MTLYLSAAGLLAALAVYLFFRRAKRALLVLTYSKIGQPSPHSRLKNEWTPRPLLERTLQSLSRRGFKTVLPSELTKNRLPAKPVMLAFMDGYQSFYTEVMPLLKKYNAKACVFLAQPYVDTYNAWQNPYQEAWQNTLTQAQLKEIKQSERVEFGALDLNRRDLTQISAEEAAFGLEENIFRLKKQLGLTVQAVAFWPAKQWNKNSARQLPEGLKELPVLTPVCGINETKKTGFLNTLRGCSWRARWALWTRR